MAVTIDELRAVAAAPTCPGAPVSLEIGNLRSASGAATRVTWHFADPGYPDQVVDGATALAGTAEETWTEIQVDAACTFASMVDADWEPGVAPTRRRWSPEEAWAALRAFMAAHGSHVAEAPGEIASRRLVLRGVTPESWAAYLNAVDDRDLAADDDQEVVPVGSTHDEHLPQWACDELDFGHGDAPALVLVGGEVRRDDLYRGTLRLVRR